MTGSALIAEFAARTFAGDVPEDVLEAARLHFQDALGVGIAASTVKGPDGWARVATPGQASLLAGGTADAGTAAMVNGALIHALEYDDTHIGSVVHGSAVAAPLALAVAEVAGLSGRETLLAYTVAWEVAIRIGLAAPGAFQARGFQATSVGGAIGAAAAAAQALGLERAQVISAIGIAGGQASGTLAFLADGASSKALNPGWAARTGLDAARMAGAGMTGPAPVLECDFGVMRAFADNVGAIEEQLATLGQVWRMPEAAYKLFPCCHYIHPFLDAMANLMGQGIAAGDVDRLTAHVAPPAAKLICEPWDRRQSPASGYDGKWGLAYCLALMLIDGRVDVASFEGAPRAEAVALARRMDWVAMENHGFPNRFAARIEVGTTGGPVIAEVPQVRGAPERPVERDDILAKFASNVGRKRDAGDVEALDRACTRLASAHDLSELTALLRG